MQAKTDWPAGPSDALEKYPLLDALRHRRSRRFGLGMKIESGPLAYSSWHAPRALSEQQEAAMAFAACGVTGYALADLAYGKAQGGQMLAGLLGRTISSADAINMVSLIVTNDEATYLLKRPQDFSKAEFPEIVELAQRGEMLELYRRSRTELLDHRAAPPVVPGKNFNINRWSLYAPGGTYFVPVNELTGLYINALLEAFDEEMAYFIVDERANFRPAGLSRFARSRGGHLDDDPGAGRFGTVQVLETSVIEAAAIEQGMAIQNLGLMGQALGLGGFPNFAPHPYAWFQALEFRMLEAPASRYLGAPKLVTFVLGLLGRDQSVPFPVGLERGGTVLLKPYCPPYYPSMEAAVRALVEHKFGSGGVFRTDAGPWREPERVASGVPAPSEAAIRATIAYCEYIHDRYGRFPAYSPPFRTVMGYQATHADLEFYDRFYRPEAVSQTQRAAWAPRAKGG